MASIVDITKGFDLQTLREGAGTETIQPFKITSLGTRFTVRQGVINNIIPSNMFSTFDINSTQTYYIFLDVFAINASVSSVNISYSLTAPDPFTADLVPATNFKILLGLIINGTVFQIRTGNITAYPVEAFRQEKSSIAYYGELPYNIYWIWSISS